MVVWFITECYKREQADKLAYMYTNENVKRGLKELTEYHKREQRTMVAYMYTNENEKSV